MAPASPRRGDTVESRSLGTYVEQEVNFKERLFVTGALRFDDNSAFGQNFDATVYPKASASWLVSEEPFFNSRLPQHPPPARPRSACRASSRAPPTRSAILQSGGRKAGRRRPTTGVSFGNLGNVDLKPERSPRVRAGFDAGLFKDRVSLEFTFYNKITNDALIERTSLHRWAPRRSQFVNLSSIRNRGVELAINTRMIDSRSR